MAQTLQEKAQLLHHLNAQKFLTLRERRQAQILEEYSFLRDRIEGEDNSDVDRSVLVALGQQLKEVLDAELIPIPKKSHSESKFTNMRDLKVKQMLDNIIAEHDLDKQMSDLVDLISRMLKLEESGVELLSSIDGEKKIFSLLNLEDPQPPILALIAALTSFTPIANAKLRDKRQIETDVPRRTYISLLSPPKVLDFLLLPNPKVREYGMHILANYSYEVRNAIPSEAVKRCSAIMAKYEEQIGFQALRCLTNLAMDEGHRKEMIEFQFTIDTLVNFLKAKNVDYQAQAACAFSNLSATPFEATAAVEILIDRLSSPSDAVVYHSLSALSNFALQDVYQNQFKSPKLLEAISTRIESTDSSIQEEALHLVATLLGKGWIKDSTFIESISLASLTLIDPEYEFYLENIAINASWCLAHLTNSYSDTRQLIFDHFGLEFLSILLEEGPSKAHIPVLWALNGLSELGTLLRLIVQARPKFRDLEILRPLVEYLFKNSSEVQVPAARVLANLVHDAANKKLIGQLYKKFAVQEPMIMARLAADTRASLMKK